MVHFSIPEQVVALFKDAPFPATTEELIAFARAQGAPDDLLVVLMEMPSHTFSNVEDLTLRWGFLHEFQVTETPPPVAAEPAPPLADPLAPTPVPEAGGDPAAAG